MIAYVLVHQLALVFFSLFFGKSLHVTFEWQHVWMCFFYIGNLLLGMCFSLDLTRPKTPREKCTKTGYV